jgi:hypothetical protein
MLHPRAVTIREVSALQLNKIFRKCYQIFSAHMEETLKDKVPNIEEDMEETLMSDQNPNGMGERDLVFY